MAATGPDAVYAALSADDEEVQRPMEIESMCMQCEENGVTRLMCVRIPYYKAVILMSFECPHCGFHNNEIQSGEACQEHGTEIVLKVKEQADLRRQLVKSEYASIEVPEVELVIPAKSQPAEVTTVEGVLERVTSALQSEQDRRRLIDAESATKIDEFCAKLNRLRELEEPWTLKLHDPTGNCFIQNPDPLHVDPRCIVSHYHRDLEETKLLGLADDDATESTDNDDPVAEEWKSYDEVKHEILHFDTDCPNCAAPVKTLMKPTDIPYFDTVIVMATTCDRCGLKTNEVKAGGAFREQGCKIEVTIEEPVDLARDVLKSDTCGLSIPALDLEVGSGALSSRFTTIEGLLNATKEQIEQQSKFFIGDSASSDEKTNLAALFQAFDDIVSLKRKDITIVLDDPAGNSYVQSLTAPLDDNRLVKTFYTRTFEQDDELGINDMKVENYGELDGIQEEDEENEEQIIA
ncbi:hypothetical protein PMAYCL1PPCAC_28726 [Pristionchus mayeri]|uniref:Zinc finger ZPR1-type domain-containing protein n=1 Tax=Pristionchus mayeri TaxID=1317129 RepID=A0AAN5IDE3_9BILA|nr:hypothetical protein PMAYCL1PPCAC_28726 [Pristionchus mayeri]